MTKTKASDIFNTGDPHLGGGYQIGYGEENPPVILSSPMTQADDRAPCAPPAPARSRVASSKPEVPRANYILYLILNRVMVSLLLGEFWAAGSIPSTKMQHYSSMHLGD